MKNIFLLIFLILFVISCSQGIWYSNNKYRPKNSNFSVVKTSFKHNSLVDNNYLYMSTKKIVNYDNKIIYNFLGFLKDGRMIANSAENSNLSLNLDKSNSWETSSLIGHYNTHINNTITTEIFVPNDGGLYIKRNGLIKKDTIIFEENINFIFKTENRKDTLIKTHYRLLN